MARAAVSRCHHFSFLPSAWIKVKAWQKKVVEKANKSYQEYPLPPIQTVTGAKRSRGSFGTWEDPEGALKLYSNIRIVNGTPQALRSRVNFNLGRARSLETSPLDGLGGSDIVVLASDSITVFDYATMSQFSYSFTGVVSYEFASLDREEGRELILRTRTGTFLLVHRARQVV